MRVITIRRIFFKRVLADLRAWKIRRALQYYYSIIDGALLYLYRPSTDQWSLTVPRRRYLWIFRGCKLDPITIAISLPSFYLRIMFGLSTSNNIVNGWKIIYDNLRIIECYNKYMIKKMYFTCHLIFPFNKNILWYPIKMVTLFQSLALYHRMITTIQFKKIQLPTYEDVRRTVPRRLILTRYLYAQRTRLVFTRFRITTFGAEFEYSGHPSTKISRCI